MIRSLTPELITLEGEYGDVAELLGIDSVDSRFLGRCNGDLTADEERYLNIKYPELMGLWPILPAVGALLAKGAKAVGTKIKESIVKKATAKKAPKAPVTTKAVVAPVKTVDAQEVLRQQLTADKMRREVELAAKGQQQKTLMMIGIPVAAALLLMMAMRK